MLQSHFVHDARARKVRGVSLGGEFTITRACVHWRYARSMEPSIAVGYSDSLSTSIKVVRDASQLVIDAQADGSVIADGRSFDRDRIFLESLIGLIILSITTLLE